MMPYFARICLAVVLGVALSRVALPAATASPPEASTTRVEPSHGPATRESELEVKRKISAGEIRYGACISDRLIETGDQPVIVFRNTCDVQVSVQLCARRPEDIGENHFGFIVSKQSESRFRLWFKAGQRFAYTYNTCGVDYCMPPDSDC